MAAGGSSSGGVDGYIPSYVNAPLVDGEIPSGTMMSVYSPDGTLLYVEQVGFHETNPTATTFNTGIFPSTTNPSTFPTARLAGRLSLMLEQR